MKGLIVFKRIRENVVEEVYKVYKEKERLDKGIAKSWCVASECKNAEFRVNMFNKCSKNNCIDCWREFMEFLDK